MQETLTPPIVLQIHLGADGHLKDNKTVNLSQSAERFDCNTSRGEARGRGRHPVAEGIRIKGENG